MRMLANFINTIVGLILVYVVVLHPAWTGQRYLPYGGFALVILVLAAVARFTDPRRWFSTVNIVLAIALGILSLLPLATLPTLTFWGGLWIGCLVPITALWAALFRPADSR
ncbi:MAG TPA: hypothetical protein VFQ88_06050 [Nevskiaceae bacterium]|nr:hypothetical protein [Nevskiaceae bacterium]